MQHKKEIYKNMQRRDFGESMCDETKLKVLNFIERQLRIYGIIQVMKADCEHKKEPCYEPIDECVKCDELFRQ